MNVPKSTIPYTAPHNKRTVLMRQWFPSLNCTDPSTMQARVGLQ